jgi:hypothetical protein
MIMLLRTSIIALMISVASIALGFAQTAHSQSSAGAQEVAGKKDAVPFPIVPIVIEYEYAPLYFLQWLTKDPRYSMIEASVNPANPPVYQIVLTEKDTGQRIYYSNAEAHVKALLRAGKKARQTPIDYRKVENVGEEPSYLFGFREEHGLPVLWRFNLASAASTRGPAMLPARQELGFFHRGTGTAAGEDTVVKIGEVENPAEPWPQISVKPYFIAFRGSFANNMETVILHAVAQDWRMLSGPSQLTEGAEWKMIDDNKNLRQFRLTARKGDKVTISEFSTAQPASPSLVLTARATAQGLVLQSVASTVNHQMVRIYFKPELDMVSDTAGSSEVTFAIDLTKDEKVMEGSIAVGKHGNIVQMRWQPRSPDWAKSRVLSSAIVIDSNGYKIEPR